MFNFTDELGVFSLLLAANLIGLLISGQARRLVEWLRQATGAAWEALRQAGSNPYLLLFLWLVFAQACGWVGVLLTLGWKVLVETQKGAP